MPSLEGAPTYYLTNFSRKLHENKFWSGGGGASLELTLRSAAATVDQFPVTDTRDGHWRIQGAPQRQIAPPIPPLLRQIPRFEGHNLSVHQSILGC